MRQVVSDTESQGKVEDTQDWCQEESFKPSVRRKQTGLQTQDVKVSLFTIVCASFQLG